MIIGAMQLGMVAYGFQQPALSKTIFCGCSSTGGKGKGVIVKGHGTGALCWQWCARAGLYGIKPHWIGGGSCPQQGTRGPGAKWLSVAG